MITHLINQCHRFNDDISAAVCVCRRGASQLWQWIHPNETIDDTYKTNNEDYIIIYL